MAAGCCARCRGCGVRRSTGSTVEAGHSVLCAPAYALVQELLAAKRDLDLPRALRKLDLFEVILIDDVGYVQQSPDEAEVLFTLLSERYERRSVMVTSNLVFRRSTAWCTTRWCSSSTCRVFERTRRARRRRHHRRPRLADVRRVRCCRGAAALRAPERFRSENDHRVAPGSSRGLRAGRHGRPDEVPVSRSLTGSSAVRVARPGLHRLTVPGEPVVDRLKHRPGCSAGAASADGSR